MFLVEIILWLEMNIPFNQCFLVLLQLLTLFRLWSIMLVYVSDFAHFPRVSTVAHLYSSLKGAITPLIIPHRFPYLLHIHLRFPIYLNQALSQHALLGIWIGTPKDSILSDYSIRIWFDIFCLSVYLVFILLW